MFQISDDLAVVQTVDFFPPIVDDAYTYGAIAAANSMSDVFAMGGDVMFALNIAAFPDDLPLEILSRIFEGGADKAAEAGIIIAGGHTVTDPEPKYGLVVTGHIHPDKIITKAGAKAGDILYLSKPLGTGVITTALKAQAADQADTDAAVSSMLELNRDASGAARDIGISACSDVTGFGLLGHATEIAIKSGVGLEFEAAKIPLLPGAERYAREGWLPGGAGRNRSYYLNHRDCGISIESNVGREIVDLLFDPETSGGLLMAVPEDRASALEASFQSKQLNLWRIGQVVPDRGIILRP